MTETVTDNTDTIINALAMIEELQSQNNHLVEALTLIRSLSLTPDSVQTRTEKIAEVVAEKALERFHGMKK